MSEGIGSKGGKKDRKLTFLNFFRKRKLKNKELEEKEQKEKLEKQEKEKNIITSNEEQTTFSKPRRIIAIGKRRQEELEKQKEPIKIDAEILIPIKEEKQIINEQPNPNIEINKQIIQTPEIIIEQEKKQISKNISIDEKINVNEQIPKKQISDVKPQNSNEQLQDNETIITYYHHPSKGTKNNNKDSKTEDEKNKLNFEYLEKEIIHILNETIKENDHQLKSIDYDIYIIKKNIDDIEQDDVKSLEKEMDSIIEKLNNIQRQLTSLEKTFDLNFPVDIPDNYLINLIDEYKEKIRNKKEFSKILEDNDEYKSILEKIIELESKKDELLEKVENKKEELELENEKLNEMNEEVLNIENEANNIKQLVDNTTKELEYIKEKVNETVHISEKLKLITKHVDHSIFEVLLLMNILKHNLSIKNNAIAAITAAATLDLIIKMCTPKTEEIKVKVCDVKDYEEMIKDCINDTEKLEKTIENNITEIDKIRYTFEHDFKELERLPEYKDIMEKLDTLESDLKERFDSTKNLTKEINQQLEKNDVKIKKFGHLEKDQNYF